ncbi:hypothetical protein BHM03_00048192 [Ensete ventricosum]|nr:hypothetical protein BHM03_00048192 [Ensete ventricosum]
MSTSARPVHADFNLAQSADKFRPVLSTSARLDRADFSLGMSYRLQLGQSMPTSKLGQSMPTSASASPADFNSANQCKLQVPASL